MVNISSYSHFFFGFAHLCVCHWCSFILDIYWRWTGSKWSPGLLDPAQEALSSQLHQLGLSTGAGRSQISPKFWYACLSCYCSTQYPISFPTNRLSRFHTQWQNLWPRSRGMWRHHLWTCCTYLQHMARISFPICQFLGYHSVRAGWEDSPSVYPSMSFGKQRQVIIKRLGNLWIKMHCSELIMAHYKKKKSLTGIENEVPDEKNHHQWIQLAQKMEDSIYILVFPVLRVGYMCRIGNEHWIDHWSKIYMSFFSTREHS
mgnify:CR=1 FL=1